VPLRQQDDGFACVRRLYWDPFRISGNIPLPLSGAKRSTWKGRRIMPFDMTLRRCFLVRAGSTKREFRVHLDYEQP
jgi:hypothetical protein